MIKELEKQLQENSRANLTKKEIQKMEKKLEKAQTAAGRL